MGNKLYLADVSVTEGKKKQIFSSDYFNRVEKQWDNSYSQLIDIHSDGGVKIHYIRLSSINTPKKLHFFRHAKITEVLRSSDFGMLLKVYQNGVQYTVWLPDEVNTFQFDRHQRFSASHNLSLSYQWEIYPDFTLRIMKKDGNDETVVVPFLLFEDPHGEFFDEIGTLNEIEKCLYRKSDWFFASRPAAVWKYLIHGSIYDPRTQKGIEKRFKCQQCAYSWWSYFGFLYNETGKQIYTILQDEVAYSVLLDMSAEGEWGHGYWSDNFETHSRFHLDGLHLLISQYVKTGQPIWLEAAERGFDFVVKHLMETLDDGSLWFLHDTIEHQRNHHFQSNLFGKSSDNSLCLNTHVQALTVLYRLRSAKPEKEIYSDIFDKGIAALQKVLDYQPGDFFYKPLLSWMVHLHTMGKPVSLLGRIKHRIEGRISSYIYWLIRPHYPRLTLPSGFTERDLTLSCFSARYHILNIKDLLSLYQQTPFPWLRPYIINGFKFIREFIVKLGLTNALASSPFYIEFIDILYLYNKLIENSVRDEEINRVKEIIYQEAGGYSLDYYASELVRGKLSD